MQQFLKQPGPDPAIKTPNDSAPAMFGHLNVLVNAITALQNAPQLNPSEFWNVNGNISAPNNKLGFINTDNPLTIISNNVQLGKIFLSNIFLGNQSDTIYSVSQNNFIGMFAGFNSSHFGSNFIGAESGYQSLAGSYNNFIGFKSGRNAANGSHNIYIGSESGLSALGSEHIFIGRNTGKNNTALGSIIAIGANAAVNNTKSVVICLGPSSGFANTGNDLIGLGRNTGYGNSGNELLCIGNFAGNGNTGNFCIAIGTEALVGNKKNNVIGFGKNAGFNNNLIGVTGATIFKTEYLPEFANHTAALAGITIGNGAVAGNTYLYRRSSDNSIGYVSL